MDYQGIKKFFELDEENRFVFCPKKGCELLERGAYFEGNLDELDWKICDECIVNYLEDADIPVIDKKKILELLKK